MDLDELERLGKAAAPAPWVVDDLGDKFFDETNHKYGIGAEASPVYRIAKVEGLGKSSEDTAAFIAASRNNWQAMIDGIRNYEFGLKSLQEMFLKGHRLGVQDHKWWIFKSNGEGVFGAAEICALVMELGKSSG